MKKAATPQQSRATALTSKANDNTVAQPNTISYRNLTTELLAVAAPVTHSGFFSSVTPTDKRQFMAWLIGVNKAQPNSASRLVTVVETTPPLILHGAYLLTELLGGNHA